MSEYVLQVKQLPKSVNSRLQHLDIELTERCNNNCIHCCINLPANDKQARRRELTTRQVKDILSQAADLGCLQVRFTGGEPLLRPDFEELYLFTRRLGLKVMLFTNARLITQHLADLMARIPPLVPIEITVYGMHKESYEAVTRVKGSFAQFKRGVNLLWERQVPFIVKSAILPPNRHEIKEFEAWAETIPWMDKRPPTYSMFFDLRNRRDDPEKNQQIMSLRLSAADGLAMLLRDEEDYHRKMIDFASKFMSPPSDKLLNCGACDSHSVCVDAYGRVQPCMGVRASQLTVDRKTRLADALDLFLSLRELRATNPDYLRRCARCVLKGFCEQCPAKAWAEHGTLDTPVEYFCEMAHAQARYLGWLGEHEYGWEVKKLKEKIGQTGNINIFP